MIPLGLGDWVRERIVDNVLCSHAHMYKYARLAHTYTIIPLALSTLQRGLGVKEKACHDKNGSPGTNFSPELIFQ